MNFEALLLNITRIHIATQEAAGQTLNRILSFRNWLIGAWIIEYEQDGEDRATYGDRLLPRLADALKTAGIKGLSRRNLNNFRQVALAYPELDPHTFLEALLPDGLTTIWQTSAKSAHAVPPLQNPAKNAPSSRSPAIWQTSAKSLHPFPSLQHRAQTTEVLEWRDSAWLMRLFSALTFSHILELSRIDAHLQRAFYELHCLKDGWSIRELKRQRGTMLYERVGLSKDKEGLMALEREGSLIETPRTVLRDPYILDFLDLASQTHFTESDLEQALLDHLQAFLLELGSDFCFMGRQYRISFGTNHYFIDLLFYHRGLRCLVAFDLKVERFRHEHAGQMNFYINYLAEKVSHPDENPPIGVILCTDKDAAEVHYATAGLEHSIFVSRYLAQLPSEEALAQWLREERMLLEEALGGGEDTDA